MEQEEKDIELIEAYHQHRLNDEELAAFERRRASDKDFDQKAEDYIHIMTEINTFGQQDFMKKVKGWEKDIAAKEKTKIIPLKRFLSMAAAIIIILIPIGYLLLSDFFKQDQQELFTAYFEPYDDVITERSEQAGLLEQALSAYNQENFRQAITYFEGYLKENPEETGIKSYLGISYLAVGETDKAERSLKEATQSGTGLFKEVSEWYLALTYLKAEQINPLKQQLKVITSQSGHMYRAQAEKLLKEIE